MENIEINKYIDYDSMFNPVCFTESEFKWISNFRSKILNIKDTLSYDKKSFYIKSLENKYKSIHFFKKEDDWFLCLDSYSIGKSSFPKYYRLDGFEEVKDFLEKIYNK